MAKKNTKEASASLRALRTSPRKLGLVAELIRGLPVGDALVQLTFNRRRVSGEVKKLLESAIANAENNNGLDVDELFIKEVNVGKAFVMKRFSARARGRGAPIKKPFSRISITLAQLEQ